MRDLFVCLFIWEHAVLFNKTSADYNTGHTAKHHGCF